MKGKVVFDDRLDVDMLTPDGEKILVPFWIKNRLHSMGLCHWDKPVKCWQLHPAFYSLEKSGLDFGSVRPAKVTASDPARKKTAPKKSGKLAPAVKMLGRNRTGSR